jgi:hypothetical protein
VPDNINKTEGRNGGTIKLNLVLVKKKIYHIWWVLVDNGE